MSLFPFINTGAVPQPTQSLEKPREYAWDFENNTFILKDGNFVVVEGLEAIKVWVKKALLTPRFRSITYSWDYGHEVENLIGNSGISRSALNSEAKRYIEEALLINSHIKRVHDFKATFDEASYTLEFAIETNYGEAIISV